MKKNVFTMRAFSVLFAVGVLALLVSCEGAGDTAADVEALRGGETRETLSPVHFTGKAARAYTAAREIPEVLDSLYCYCDCKEGFGHKSLLSCHVDQHSKYCSICMDEAILALEMHNDGKDISAIRTAVDKKFSGRGN